MAEVELVIKVSEEVYNRFGHEYSEENLISKYTNDAILEAFCNGTPLPKGHGRLIDADKLHHCGCKGNFSECDTCLDDDLCNLVDNAPTIIEADTPKRKKGTPLEENDSGYNCENWIP